MDGFAFDVHGDFVLARAGRIQVLVGIDNEGIVFGAIGDRPGAIADDDQSKERILAGAELDAVIELVVITIVWILERGFGVEIGIFNIGLRERDLIGIDFEIPLFWSVGG